ncbi:mediator of RNA polymerase II transcription subunit 24-like isoform X4 [Anneissia japonica]|uniref:mediator of RNA polymerase II transcription subunit 24-like isoform X4 n=1 Tax=Anneissia japonica TaxID=1529436 RepID=UPI0014257395|nr:mediator of RNA polymerase II transcription subunit 24-like isoform X4 [Anneissia japonica]
MDVARSKSELLQQQVMQAWRERWSDVQWSTEIKKIVPRGMSGDAFSLAEILLNQIFVGPTPNSLILTYLEHAISCQIVSCTAIFNSIITYEDICIQRPYCMKGLLDILFICVSKLGGHTMDEGMYLAKSYLRVVLWLLDSITACVEKIKDTTTKVDVMMTHMLDILIDRFHKMVCMTGVSRLLLFIGKSEDEEAWRTVQEAVMRVKESLTVSEPESGQPTPVFMKKELKEKVLRSMQDVLKIPYIQIPVTQHTNSIVVKGTSCIINMITFLEAAINITNDVQCFVDQILLIEKVQHIQRHTLVKELCHSALLGLVDHIDSVDELKWHAFAFVKLPQIFSCLKSGPSFGRGIKELLRLNTLLDTADSKSKCDCLQHLLSQCVKLDVISEALSNEYIQQRANQRNAVLPSKKESSPLPNATLIQQAETMATSILSEKTFNDPDFSKIQEDLLGVLGHLIAGKSFDLIVAAEAGTGKLKIFTSKLIRFNEWAKNASGEGGKQSQVRALLFDFTFLMLCHIAQMYGVQMVLDKTDSFFESWIVGCLPSANQAKPLESMIKADQNKVELLLMHCATGMEFKTSLVRWHEACACAPQVMEEILNAWLHNTISASDVKKIIDNMKSKLHCLSVCVVAWLCSYLRSLQNSERDKAKQMLLMFMAANTIDSTLVPYDKERNTIKVNVIKKMTRMSMGGLEVNPEFGLKTSSSASAIETLSSIFHGLIQQGFMNKALFTAIEQLQSCLGVEYFCRSVIDEVLKLNSKADLMIAVEIALGMFYINIEQICPILIKKVIPLLISDTNNNKRISGARGHALACIVVWTIASAITYSNNTKDFKIKDERQGRGTKRPRSEFEKEDTGGLKDEGRLLSNSKLRRLLSSPEDDSTPEVTGSQSTGFIVPNVHYLIADPLNRAIATLLQLFSSVIQSGNAGPRSEFINIFFQELLHCNDAVVKHVLQFAAASMVDHLLCVTTSGGSLFFEFVMAVSNLGSSTARNMAIKALCVRKR